MASCVDAFSRSFSHSIRLLFQPFRMGFWLKAALLILFIQGLAIFSPFEYLQGFTDLENPDQIAERTLEILPTLLGLFFVSMLISVIMEALHAWACFLYFDALRDGFIYYRPSTNRNGTGIVTFFLWNLVMKLVIGGLVVVSLIVLLIPTWLLTALFQNQTGLILALTFAGLFALFLLSVYIVYIILLYGVVIPQMAVKSKGIFEAWKESFQIAFNQPGELLGYALIRIILWCVAFFCIAAIAFFYGLCSAGFSTLLGGSPAEFGEKIFAMQAALPLQIIIAFLLLPLFTLRTAYTLCFLSDLKQDRDYEPKGGESSVSLTAVETPPSPPSPPILPVFQKQNETDPIDEPVSFKDIPTERFSAGPDIPPPSDASPQNNDNQSSDCQNPPPPPVA